MITQRDIVPFSISFAIAIAVTSSFWLLLLNR